MRNLRTGLAMAATMALCVGARATPITATYSNETASKAPTFQAIFYYDSDSLVQDMYDTSLFNGVGHMQSATLSIGADHYSFTASDYFYEKVISGVTPDYEFGIRQADGSGMYLVVNGDAEYGLYYFADGAGDNLYPTRVTIEPGVSPDVSPVPLPPASALFAGSLLALGLAGHARFWRSAASVKPLAKTAA